VTAVRFLLRPVFAALILCLLTSRSNAEIKIPNLNPFAKKSTIPEPPKRAESKSGPLTLPKLPTVNLFPKKKPGEPSTLEKMNRSTKAFFTKTADVLNPFNDKPKESRVAQRSVTGSRSMFTSDAYKQKEEKKSGFFPFSIPSPFKSKDVEPKKKYEKPRGVNDFLKQQRVPIE